MYKSEIVSSLSDYSKKNPKLTFYGKCLDFINNYKFEDDMVKNVTRDEYLLESLRITLCYDLDKYHVYLYNKRKDKCTNYKLNLREDIHKKFVHHLLCISNDNDILSLAKTYEDVTIEYQFIIISKSPAKFKNKVHELKNLYEIGRYIFGLEIFDILKYQRLDRIKNFIENDHDGMEKYKRLNMLNKYLKTFDWQTRERMIIFSGTVLETIGLTYTRDVDLMIIDEHMDLKKVKQIFNKFSNHSELDVEPLILAGDENWYTQESQHHEHSHEPNIKSNSYKKIWLTIMMPRIVGAENIFEIISNPKYNYGFCGLKISSLDMNVGRFLSRSNTNSFTDFIMMKKINGYDFGKSLCIPNMTIRQGKIIVFDDKKIQDMYKDIQKKLISYYNQRMEVDDIKHTLQKCNANAYDIYKGIQMHDPDTGLIKRFHLDVKQQIFSKYCKNVDYLLDIGSGQLTDTRFWNIVGIKHVIGIEPSLNSIKNGLKKLESYHIDTDIDIINGLGDDIWKNDKKYNPIFEHKYDVITFQFMIHYMIKNIDDVLNNIKQVANPHAKIIITCMDGAKIHKKIHENKILEVRNKEEPIFAVIPMYDYKLVSLPDNNQSVVYFKGAYGVASGSVEPLVNIEKLISIFKEHNIKLVEIKPFLEYNSKFKNMMTPTQKSVSNYYTSIIFECQ